MNALASPSLLVIISSDAVRVCDNGSGGDGGGVYVCMCVSVCLCMRCLIAMLFFVVAVG